MAISCVGFEIWQVKAGTIFDNILITDDIAEAEKWAEKTKATQEGEKKMKEHEEEQNQAKEEVEEEEEEDDDMVMVMVLLLMLLM